MSASLFALPRFAVSEATNLPKFAGEPLCTAVPISVGH
jgi:hypothetical protein